MPFDLHKMKQSHWLLYGVMNCDSSRKWNRGKGRIELRNLQILKEVLEKSSQFLSSEQPCDPKTLDVALTIAGLQK